MSREGRPKTLAYPVANRELREALGPLPSVKDVRFRFRRPPVGAAEFRRLVESAAPLPTIAARYRNWNAWQEPASRPRKSIVIADEWWVEVYAVPRESRPVCHDALLNDGVTVIRDWLVQPRSTFWIERPPRRWQKQCLISVDPQRGSIEIDEED
jgi:hypothetical protein